MYLRKEKKNQSKWSLERLCFLVLTRLLRNKNDIKLNSVILTFISNCYIVFNKNSKTR